MSTMTHDAVDLGAELVTYAARLVRLARQANDLSAGTRVLALLDQHGPMGVSALADLDGCSQPTMSTLVAGLATEAYVVKEPHPGDARASLVGLTTAGATELSRVRRRNGEAIAERVSKRPDPHRSLAELATAVALLRDLLDPEEVSS